MSEDSGRLARKLEELGGADITAALENLPVQMFVLDSEGVSRWQNKASRDAVGDRVGSQWGATSGSSIPAVADLWPRLLSGEPVEAMLDIELADGSVERHEVSAVPLHDGGAVIGVFGQGIPAGCRADVTAADFGLTPRQGEVLQLLADGRSTDQIAAELYLSRTTVRNHIANILSVLKVHTRVQAVILAARAGLIRTR